MVVNVTASPRGNPAPLSLFFPNDSTDKCCFCLTPPCADEAGIQTEDESQDRSDEASCLRRRSLFGGRDGALSPPSRLIG